MIHRERTDACLSDLALDRRLAGELREEEETLARQHLASCSRCERRWAALHADREAFLRGAPALAVAPLPGSVRPPARGLPRPAGRPPRRRWLTAGIGAAAAAGVAALAAAAAPVLLRSSVEDGTRTKGSDVRFGFYVSHAGSVRAGGPGEIVAPGDSLRFTYASPEARYVGVVSVDGAGRVSTYFPDPSASGTAPRIEAGAEVALPLSTVLDDVLGEEYVHGVACPRPFDVEALRASVERSPGRSPVAPGCVVQTIILRKEARRP